MSSLVDVTKRLLKLERRVDALSAIEVAQSSAPWTVLGNIVSLHLGQPFIRGYWPGNAVGYSGYLNDLSVGANPMAPFNSPVLQAHATVPRYWANLSGTSYYQVPSDANAFKITGTESYIATAQRGLTLGLWVYFWSFPSVQSVNYIFCKWTTSLGNRSYALTLGMNASLVPYLTFRMQDPSDNVAAATWLGVPEINKWYWLAGRYKPSVEVALFVNGEKTTTTSSIPASIKDTTAQVTIGAASTGLNDVDIAAAHAFICAGYLSDNRINHIYQSTRGMHS